MSALNRSHATTFSNYENHDTVKALLEILLPSGQLLVQSRKWKHQHNIWKLFKVNGKVKRTTSCSGIFIINFEHISNISKSGASIANFEQVNTRLENGTISFVSDL